MFSFDEEVLITEIIDAIERKEPVRAGSFPAGLRPEPGSGPRGPGESRAAAPRQEGCSAPGQGEFLSRMPLPSLNARHTGVGRQQHSPQPGRVLGSGRNPPFCSRLSLLTALLSKSHFMLISTSLESGRENMP